MIPENQNTDTIINKKNITIIALAVAIIGLLMFYVSTLSQLSQSWSEFFNRLGTVLFSSILVAIIYDYFLRDTFIKEMRSQIKETIITDLSQVKELQNAGIEKIHSTFPTNNVSKAMCSAKDIWIFNTSLPDFETFEKSIFDALKYNNCNIKILLLCPISDFAKNRSKDLGSSFDYLEKDIKLKINRLYKKYNECNNNNGSLNIKINKNSTPTFLSYAYDDVIVFTPYFRKPGFQSPNIEIRGNKSILFKEIKDHFDKIWNDDDTVSAENCLMATPECYKSCKKNKT